MKMNFKSGNFLSNYIAILFILMLPSALFFSSCKHTSSKLSKAEMKTIVEKQNSLLESCFTKGDVEKLAEMYTDSAKLSPNNYRFITGRDSIKAFWVDDFKSLKTLKMGTNVLQLKEMET